MDDVAFIIEHDTVVPIVNGVDLPELFGRAGLLGFSPRMVPPSGELFSERETPGGDGRPLGEALPVLICGCGEAGCGSVTVALGAGREVVSPAPVT